MRTVTDGGAIRKKRRKFNSWITRLDVARDVARAQIGTTADAARFAYDYRHKGSYPAAESTAKIDD